MHILQCPGSDLNCHQLSQKVSLQTWAGALMGIHKMFNGAFRMVLLTECVLIRFLSAHLFFPTRPVLHTGERDSHVTVGVTQWMVSITTLKEMKCEHLKL